MARAGLRLSLLADTKKFSIGVKSLCGHARTRRVAHRNTFGEVSMRLSWAVLCTAFLGCAEARPPTDPQQSGKADELFQAGRFDEAATLYKQVIAQNPRDGHAYLRLGQIALFSNQFPVAQGHLIRAHLLKEAEAARLLGELYYRQDDFAHAAEWFRKAGRDVFASKLEHFKGQIPYQIDGSAENRVPLVSLDPVPLVKARVNESEEVNLLIDTAGGELILGPAFARKIGALEFGAVSDTIHASVGSVQLGEWTIRNVPVVLLDIQRFADAAGGAHIDGIIGTTFLYHFSPTLRYPQRELVLRRPGSFASVSGIGVPFWLADDHLIVVLGTVNHAPPTLMLVYSGLAGMGFAAPSSTLEAAKINLSQGEAIEGTGASTHETRVVPFVVEEVALGEVRVPKVAGVAGAFPGSLERGLGFQLGGLVSHTFLRPFSVTFDFQKMQIFFSKGQNVAAGD
jgi:hypothetical protein